jgi:c-di-GMP-related signal transduction protein
MLAEKVETREQFVAAKQAGFSYFQGYFFQRPQVLQARDIPANRLNYLRLMQAISHENVEPRQIEQIVKSEASLCYRLLRYLNSPVFGFYSEIQSVRHALAILGEREVRRWIRLVATLTVAQDKSNELVLSALVRARFCELLAPQLRHDESDLFLLGLLSLLDTILDLAMFSILEQIPVDRETKAVLLGQPSELSPLYELVVARESGQWEKTELLSTQLSLPESFIAESFWKATEWANQANGAA